MNFETFVLAWLGLLAAGLLCTWYYAWSVTAHIRETWFEHKRRFYDLESSILIQVDALRVCVNAMLDRMLPEKFESVCDVLDYDLQSLRRRCEERIGEFEREIESVRSRFGIAAASESDDDSK